MRFNEVDIFIGEKTRKMVATMANLYDIEEKVGSVVSLIKKTSATGSGIKIKELIDIIYYAMNGDSDNRLERKSVELEVFRNGYTKYMLPVQQFLYIALSGGEAQAKGETAPETPKETPTS